MELPYTTHPHLRNIGDRLQHAFDELMLNAELHEAANSLDETIFPPSE